MPIDLISNIAPKNNGSFPMVEDVHFLGGLQIRSTTTDRNNIPTLNRKEGMLVYVTADSTLYQLSGGITNSNWIISPIGVSDGFDHTSIMANTTTATPLTVFTMASPPTDGLVFIKVTMMAGNDVDERAAFTRTARINYDAGVASLFDQQTDYTSKDNSGWEVNIVASGANLEVQVTGNASPITWNGCVSTKSMTTPAFIPPTPGINESTFPSQIDLVLGPFWSNIHGFSEDDVVTLNRVAATMTAVIYTEDGTTTANTSTNRIQVRMTATTNTTGSNYWYMFASGANSTYFTSLLGLPYTQGTPSASYLERRQSTDVAYTFLDLFNNNDNYGSAWPNVFKSMVAT